MAKPATFPLDVFQFFFLSSSPLRVLFSLLAALARLLVAGEDYTNNNQATSGACNGAN